MLLTVLCRKAQFSTVTADVTAFSAPPLPSSALHLKKWLGQAVYVGVSLSGASAAANGK